MSIKCVLSIAGSDPSGGAGMQADIKSISATGCYAASVLTVLIAQNTQGVQAIYEIPASFVTKQIDSVLTDLEVHAIKIGLLYNTQVMECLHAYLQIYPKHHVVLDPVMCAKSGACLLDVTSISSLTALFPQVGLITPNIPEAEQLLEITIQNRQEQAQAAEALGRKFQVNVLIKGGHLPDEANDVLYLYDKKYFHWFYADRIHSGNTHGTGCSLSSAIASYLAQGFSLIEAITQAKQYLTNALIAGRHLEIGQGCGPIDHFYFLRNDHNAQ